MLKRAFITRNSCYNVNQHYLVSKAMDRKYSGMSDILIKSGIFAIAEDEEKLEDEPLPEDERVFSADEDTQTMFRIRRECENRQKIRDELYAQSENASSMNARETYEFVTKNTMAYIVDVRTQAESIYAGSPDLSDIKKEPINIPFKLYPSMRQNPRFVDTFKDYFFNKDATTFLLCNDGNISKSIVGDIREFHENCYAIEDGFNGPKHEELNRRGLISGWKAEGLPWQER